MSDIDFINLPAASAAPSPFLPGTNIRYAWDSTTLGAFKTCARLYWYQYVEGWQSKEESIHLRFGIEYHTALQNYSNIRATEDLTHEEALHIVVKDILLATIDFNPDITGKVGKYKNRSSLIRTVINYLDKFPDESDPAKTYIMVDGSPAVELSFRFELDWGPKSALQLGTGVIPDSVANQPYILCGHLDRVVEYQDTLFVMDHKTTTKTLSDYYFSQYEPNNQMTLYTVASKIVLDSPVKGVMVSGAQLLVEDNEFKRSFTYRTPGVLDEWLVDLKQWLDLAEHYAITDHWPMNDMACGNFGGCKFKDICSKDPRVRPNFLKSSFTKLETEDRWNPLKPR